MKQQNKTSFGNPAHKTFNYTVKPLNVITYGQTKSDNINQMITITGCFYLLSFSKWDYEM